MYFDVAKWFWEQFGSDVASLAKSKWREFNWAEAEQKYRHRLNEIHSTTRLLGHSKLLNVNEIFTDVYVLDKLTAHRRFGLKNLLEAEKDISGGIKRKAALRLAISESKLFILGKPGAGKTTFLKYLILKACEGKIKRTPIFVSLKEWSDSEKSLIDYLIKQFEICSFPDAETFINRLLKSGKALILFDGLDEVRQEGDIRSEIIKLVNDFAKEFSNNQIFITCRIAAVEYSFEHFIYAEIADFDSKQTATFVQKWYQGQSQKAKRFASELKKPENRGFLDLTKTPLLLALLCLAYDELLEFPERRVDLYKEAFDALLKKWDASRDIQRDEIYKGLSALRKENLLSRIAYRNFLGSKFFFRQETLVQQISEYLNQLPEIEFKQSNIDGEAVLRAIEAQHGLIIERAYGIYSFSHLTFQEYLTARYIVQNAGIGTLEELARNIHSDQWSEVIAIAVSLLDNADILFSKMFFYLNSHIRSKKLTVMFKWIINKSALTAHPKTCRALLLLWQLSKEYFVCIRKTQQLALRHIDSQELAEALQLRGLILTALDKCLVIALQFSHHYSRSRSISIELISIDEHLFRLSNSDFTIDSNDILTIETLQSQIKLVLDQILEIGIEDLEKHYELSNEDYKELRTFLDGTAFIFRSLDLATVSDRGKLQEMILLPKS